MKYIIIFASNFFISILPNNYSEKKWQVPPGTPVVNALSKQRAMLENIMRACVGLAPENNMILEYK